MTDVDPSGFTIKEIVLEIREDVKQLARSAAVADAKAVTALDVSRDHEVRLRRMERFRYAFPSAIALSVAASVSALALHYVH